MGVQVPETLPGETTFATEDGSPLYTVEDASRRACIEAAMVRYWLKNNVIGVAWKDHAAQGCSKPRHRPLFDDDELTALLIAVAVYQSPRGCRTSWITHTYNEWLERCRKSQKTAPPTTGSQHPRPPAAAGS